MKRHVGILGIERQLEERRLRDSGRISDAFRDLKPLMQAAQDMAALARKISQEVRDKKGAISDDETVQFRAHLLCLGVDDPVTRSAAGNESNYYALLAGECCETLQHHLRRVGGLLSLLDSYVYVNRARGFELISPNDFREACARMNQLRLPVRMERLRSGLWVLRSEEFDFHRYDQRIIESVQQAGCSTAEELSPILGVSAMLTLDRLLALEERGSLCRDETVEGLRFYPNKFLTE